ncbi:hypothetical protein DRK59_00520 [Salmonella enterica subsp. diarizonae]|nr:hypothetical protein [Salmonella enterica]ECE0106920.1 hypothetical protein [Salmonella enterica subsp. diarizonae]EAQ6115381.1 hypothetical protein [Salmonella enterica]MLU15725.1 hypothetical protein [Salmonella enterica subsp. diarizonae]HEA0264268.1 hypothetical protein [Salmonella enterica]
MLSNRISLSNPERIPFWKTELISPGINCVRQPRITSLKRNFGVYFLRPEKVPRVLDCAEGELIFKIFVNKLQHIDFYIIFYFTIT